MVRKMRHSTYRQPAADCATLLAHPILSFMNTLTATLDQASELDAAFAVMTPVQKRHAIARDVLGRLHEGQLIAKTRKWAYLLGEHFKEEDTLDLRTLIIGPKKVACECCAIGAAIVGLAVCEDRITADVLQNGTNPRMNRSVENRLIELFSFEQMCLIEAAFEGTYNSEYLRWHPGAIGVTDMEAANVIFDSALGAKDRLAAIWTAILEHPEGLFDAQALAEKIAAST